MTALSYASTQASRGGHTESLKALLAAPGINVNHADVSIYPFTTSYVIVAGEGVGHLLHVIPPAHLSAGQ